MDLHITNNDVDYGLEAYKISLDEFGCKEIHPFIAANKWDKVYIDVTDSTPLGIIRQLVTLATIRPVIDKSNVTARMMQVLCEIFPDSAAKLRSLYVKDRNAFNTIVDELIE